MDFRVKMQQNGRKNIFTDKQNQRRYRCFYMLMWFRKGNYCMIGLFQQRSKVKCMYLAFSIIKISSEKVQQSS